jgi:hypothetical protein
MRESLTIGLSFLLVNESNDATIGPLLLTREMIRSPHFLSPFKNPRTSF